MSQFFMNDWWLSSQIATESTDAQQNYYQVIVNSELELRFSDFATCLNASGGIDAPVSFDGWDVTPINTADDPDWQHLTYHADIGYLVAAGDAGAGATGNAMTSPDGITWTPLVTPTANYWWPPIYVPSKTLIVVPTDGGGGSNFLTSVDAGATWVAGTTGLGNATMKGIIWSEEAGIYVAWGWSGALRYSTDLVTWFEATISTVGGYWDDISGIAYSPSLGMFCTTGIYGDVYTSTDGMVWTWQNLASFAWDSNWSHIAWSPTLGLFVAQGEHHENFTQTEMFMSSEDGVTWTIRPLGIALTNHNDPVTNTFLPAFGLKWDDNTSKFYALTEADNNAGNGTSLVTPSMLLLTSSDGINWAIDTTVPSTHALAYPVFGTKEYRDIAFKDANNMAMVNMHSVTYKI